MPALTDYAGNGLYLAIASIGIGCCTWFFANRRRLIIRISVPREELREAARPILRDPNFARGMRSIAALQLAIGIVIGLISAAAIIMW
jgi:hypothetical protein